MPLIHILDEPTINQIAAGEVVERPSAVVKELIENAMDAGATAITAEIKEGGLSFIRITDNGAGIAKEDIPLAFLRHATSKIKSAEDLLSVTSLGFRGEALSSIAAVAQVELITKTPSDLNGYRYVIEGGEEKSLEEIGCPGGTTMIIRNLFFNTPARRKFLKSAMTEAGYISDLMERLIVSHPNVSFKFIVNNQVKLQSSGNNNSKDILYHVYGRDISKELLPITYAQGDTKISGYIGKPIITRGNRNFENYFINGRYIKSNVITKAIEEAYKPFLMQHKYPFTSIYFEIDPAQIDVNVHPQKMEIRLKNGEEIYQLTYQLIREALTGKELIPMVALTHQETTVITPPKMPEPFEVNRRKLYEGSNSLNGGATGKLAESSVYQIQSTPNINTISSQTLSKSEPVITDNITIQEKSEDNIQLNHVDYPTTMNESDNDNKHSKMTAYEKDAKNIETTIGENIAKNSKAMIEEIDTKHITTTLSEIEAKNIVQISSNSQMTLFGSNMVENETPFLSKKALEEHRIIGQIFATYWLVEYKKELYIIDQHAAHEKVLYERIMTSARDKTFASQQLLPPIVLTLTLREQDVINKHEELLKSLGYEIEHFGGKEYSVRAVPADLFSISEKELLLEFLDDMAEEVIGSTASTNSILEKVASLSCKAAVKANHTFSNEEATALIKELLTLENPYHCPHGRPVIVSMSQYELERKFKRIL